MQRLRRGSTTLPRILGQRSVQLQLHPRHASSSTAGVEPSEQPLARVSFTKKNRREVTKQEPEVRTAEELAVSGGPSLDRVAMPRPAHNVPARQSPNVAGLWSAGQNPRENAMRGPRFEQTSMAFQPQPLSAMGMIAEEPIRLVEERIASCDGGGGPLGHPKVFINVDKPGPKACGYCGIRFERAAHSHH